MRAWIIYVLYHYIQAFVRLAVLREEAEEAGEARVVLLDRGEPDLVLAAAVGRVYYTIAHYS